VLGRHAFKVLCPDGLVSSVIGPGGRKKDELQAETGCKMVLSNREEFYPGTRLRVLIIYGDNMQGMVACLERMVQNVGECALEEQRRPGFNMQESDYFGKEAGEFMLRAAIPTKASGAIIGPRGVNIQAIRDEFNARVFIEKTVEEGHQVLKLVAALDNMRHAIIRINEGVQEDSHTDAFREWAAVRTFSSDTAGAAWNLQEGKGEKGGGKAKGGGKRERSRSRGRGEANSGQRAMEVLADATHDFPDGVLEEMFTLTCDLPRGKVTALIGPKGEHVRHVRKLTNTNIRFDEAAGQDTQTMWIKGKMLDCYRAHSLMMRRYHEDDRDKDAVDQQKTAHVQGLQAQLAEIQKQLAMVGTGKGGLKGVGKKGF